MNLLGFDFKVSIKRYKKSARSFVNGWLNGKINSKGAAAESTDIGLTLLHLFSYIMSGFYGIAVLGNHDKIYQFQQRQNKRLDKIVYKDRVKLIELLLGSKLVMREDTIYFRDIVFPYYGMEGYFEVLLDTFALYFCGKPYTRANVDFLDAFCQDGNYLLDDIDCPMMIKKGDVVFDIGAWYGDFSVLAATAFGASVYAFEPQEHNFSLLKRTIDLNQKQGDIIPFNLGVGSSRKVSYIDGHGGGASINDKEGQACELTTIDDFVRNNNIARLDFIKADIEGYEREMLRGATQTLKSLAPKLSLCTYHLPDDPQVLRELISGANPAYRFEQRKGKLFAWAG